MFEALQFAGLLLFIGEAMRNFEQRYSNSFLKMALCVLLSFIVFYSVSGTKLPNYPMPCYSFGAIVLGYFITQAMNGNIRTKIYPFIILLVINFALPVGLYFWIKYEI